MAGRGKSNKGSENASDSSQDRISWSQEFLLENLRLQDENVALVNGPVGDPTLSSDMSNVSTGEKLENSSAFGMVPVLDYFALQKALRLDQLKNEETWLERQLGKANKQETARKKTTYPKEMVKREWEANFDPVDVNAMDEKLLDKFQQYLERDANRANEILDAFWDYKQVNGSDKCHEALMLFYKVQYNDIVADTGLTVDELQKIAKDQIQQKYPVTTISQLNWLLTPRFAPGLNPEEFLYPVALRENVEEVTNAMEVIVIDMSTSTEDDDNPRATEQGEAVPETATDLEPPMPEDAEMRAELENLWFALVTVMQLEGQKSYTDLKKMMKSEYHYDLDKNLALLGFRNTMHFINWGREMWSEGGKNNHVSMQFQGDFPTVVFVRGTDEECLWDFELEETSTYHRVD